MNKTLALVALVATLAIPAAAFADESPMVATASAPTHVVTGRMLYAAGGRRLAPVYRVLADGSPQVILDGRLVTVPVATLSETDGKVGTSLTVTQIATAR